MGSDRTGDDFAVQIKQLTLEFSALPREQIEKSVERCAESYSEARITTFVGLLVEREAREELRSQNRSASEREAS